MEVGELMAFKPVTAPKRPAQKDSESGDYEEGDASYEMRAAKRRKAKQAKIAAVAAQKRLEQERMAMLESELEQSNGVGNHDEEDSSLTSEQRAAIQQHIEYGGDVKIFSSMHVSGEQLEQLTGICAILRFPMQELEDSDSETDE